MSSLTEVRVDITVVVLLMFPVSLKQWQRINSGVDWSLSHASFSCSSASTRCHSSCRVEVCTLSDRLSSRSCPTQTRFLKRKHPCMCLCLIRITDFFMLNVNNGHWYSWKIQVGRVKCSYRISCFTTNIFLLVSTFQNWWRPLIVVETSMWLENS